MHSTDDIDAKRLYSLSEAAALIPSPISGKRTCLHTLYRWRAEGRITAVARQGAKGKKWFVWGAEILRFLGASEAPVWRGRTAKQRERATAAAMAFVASKAAGKRGVKANAGK